MKYTVYETTNLHNGKIYIGVHKTNNPCDRYIGSGKILKEAIQKYGRDAFVKKVLYVFNTPKEAYEKEKELVDIDFINRNDTYNIAVGGSVSPAFDKDRRARYSEMMSGDKHPQYGKKQSAESNAKRSASLRGRKMSPSAIQKSADARRGQISPFKGTKRTYQNSLKGTAQTAEANAKRSKSHLSLPKKSCRYCERLVSPSNHQRHEIKCQPTHSV